MQFTNQARGYLIGEENEGLNSMFIMMSPMHMVMQKPSSITMYMMSINRMNLHGLLPCRW